MAKGDHIKVKKRGYYHHGIDIGNEKVIHFTGGPGSKRNASIVETSLAKFLNGKKLEIIHYAKSLSSDETIQIAKSRLGEKEYSLIFNNCEHFARYCKTRQHKSEQVKDTTSTTSASVGVGAVTTASIVGVSASGTVAGLSGPGIMAGLATIGPGGVMGGIATLAVAPTVISNIAVSIVLEDDEHLPTPERHARKAGRYAAKLGTAGGAVGTLATISASGTTAGLSAAGITSGLASIGGYVGGGMLAGTVISIAAPAVATAAVGYGVYKVFKWFKKDNGLTTC